MARPNYWPSGNNRPSGIKPTEDTTAALLGCEDDEEDLVEALRLLRRDDLADKDDSVQSATRVQVRRMSRWRKYGLAVITCGLSLLCEARSDVGLLVLTRKGHVICYGKGPAARTQDLVDYLVKVMRVLIVVCLICFLVWFATSEARSFRIEFQSWETYEIVVLGVAVLAVVMVYIYAQRPRFDCGRQFRQHFDVNSLCAGSYARADHGRRVFLCCCGPRRREGHLKLSFGFRYPDALGFNEGCPFGAPDLGLVHPSTSLPAATAGDLASVQREAVEAAGFSTAGSMGLMTGVLAVLASLSMFATFFDYVKVLTDVAESGHLCSHKISGCHWKVDNLPFIQGRQRLVPDTFPPYNRKEAGCDSYGQYCDYFYKQPEDCSTVSSEEALWNILLPCEDVDKVRDTLRTETSKNAWGLKYINYVLGRDLSVISLPIETMPNGGKVNLEENMRLYTIGAFDSVASQALRSGTELPWSAVMEDCNFHKDEIEMTFQKEVADTPLFEDDCKEMQDACMAANMGADETGWWPPTRWLSKGWKKTICVYHGLPTWYSNRGTISWVALQDHTQSDSFPSSSLTCHGDPLKEVQITSLPNMTSIDRVDRCKQKCEDTKRCKHFFYNWAAANGSMTTEEAPGVQYFCTLYAECVRHGKSKHTRDSFPSSFRQVNCGDRCDWVEHQRCQTLDHGRLLMSTMEDGFDNFADYCRNKCLMSGSVGGAQCMGYIVAEEDQICIVRGSHLSGVDEDAPAVDLSQGFASSLETSKCFVRDWPPEGFKRVNKPGQLYKRSDKYMCGGCYSRTLFDFLSDPSNFLGLLTNVLTIFGVYWAAKEAGKSRRARKAIFQGKPTIGLDIVQDEAEPEAEAFDARELGLVSMGSHIFAAAWARKEEKESKNASPGGTPKPPEKDIWDQEETERDTARNNSWDRWAKVIRQKELDVRPAEGVTSYEDYELTNKMRTECYVCKELLGMHPDETVSAAWSETQRVGLLRLMLPICLYLFFASCMLYDREFGEVWYGKLIAYWIIPGFYCVWYYLQVVRRAIQCLCVVTSMDRIISLYRQPPGLCSCITGGVSIKLDWFCIGHVVACQLDMPAYPLCWDRVCTFTGVSAWKRGLITLKGEHGFLQIHRKSGDALAAFRAISMLTDPKAVKGLRSVGDSGRTLQDVCPVRDLYVGGESHVYERRMDSFGLFYDPYDYAAILNVTDRRVLLTRTRIPKVLSLRGILMGPLTCGNTRFCRGMTQCLGYQPYITVASLAHDMLESYATVSERVPPLWPGLGPPVASLGVAFLGKYMQTFPSSLEAVQRPYGIPTDVKLDNPVWLRDSDTEGAAVIHESQQSGAPRGNVVSKAWDENGQEVDFDSPDLRQPGGLLLGPGAELQLEACDPEWGHFAEEPWVRQMRVILDGIANSSVIPEDTWREIDEYEEPDMISTATKMCGLCCGAAPHPAGHGTSDEDGSMDTEDDHSEGYIPIRVGSRETRSLMSVGQRHI